MRKRTTALVLVMTLVGAIPAMAGSSSAVLNISVQVVARTILTIESQPASIELTPADIARGYVELPQAVIFHVRSNASQGYTLQFDPLAGPFARAEVTYGGSVATIGTDGAWLIQPYRPGTTSGTLSVRLTLAPGAQAGTYSWPVGFAANTL